MTKRQAVLHKLLSPLLGTLLLVAAAPAGADDLELMGALWVGESGGVLKINATNLNLDLEVPDPLGVSAIAVDTGRRTVWAFVQPNLLAFDFTGQQILSVPIPTTGTTAHLVVRPSDGSVWLSVDTDLYNVSTGGSILTTTTLPGIPLEIDIYGSAVLWVATADAVTAHDAVTGAQIGSVDDLGNRPKIRDIAVYNSTLWVGLTPGPRQYTVNSSGTATFKQEFSINGLTHIDQAALNRAWAATSNDLVSIRLFPFNTGTTSNGDPFPGKEATLALVASGPDERVFIASDEGRVARMSVLGTPEYIQGLPPVAIRDLAAFPRETVPPNINITSPRENEWVTTLRPTVVISYSDSGSGVDPSTLIMSSGYACTTSATGADCTSTSDQFEGGHLVFARVNDFAGNFSAQIQRSFFIDATPPTISITSPVAGATLADPFVPIDVAYSDARSGIRTSSLAIQANGVDLPVSCSAGASSATCTPLQELPSGPVALTASVEDIAGLTSVSAPVDITISSGVDTTPPDLEIAGPWEGLLSPDPQPRIVLLYGDSESGVDTATLSLQKDGAELQRQCTFGADRAHCALLAPLPEGPATLTATIADVAGNTSAVALRSFTVIAPTTTVLGTVLDSGGAPAVGAQVAVLGAGTALTASDGSFSIPAVPISTGQRLTVVARTGLGEGALVAGARDLVPAADGTTDAGTLTLQPLCVPLLVGGFNDMTGVGMTSPTEADVFALQVHDDGTGSALYVGGTFNLAGGLSVSNLARFDGTQWSDVGGGVFGTVHAMEVFDDGTGPQLYVAGSFFQAGGSFGIPVENIARWDGQTWHAVGAGTNGTVRALEVYDDGTGPALYVGGDFTSAGGSTANHVARWDGLSWSEVGGGVNRFVSDLLVADLGSGPELVAGGDFSTAGGLAAQNIATWNGTSWAPLGAGPGAAVSTLALHDDGSGPALYTGSSQFVSRWDGLQWVAVGAASAPAASAQVLLSHDDGAGPALYAGVSLVGGLQRWDGVSWSGVGGGITNVPVSPQIRALASFDDLGLGFPASLFVGGRFNNAGGLPSEAFAKWYRECGPIDRTPPRIDVTVPEPGSATNLTQVSFAGSLSEPADLTFDGTPVTVDASLQFTHGPVSLIAGLNSFELIATDSAGNVARLAAQIYQDGSPPAIAFESPLAGETVDLGRPRIVLEHSDDLGIDPSTLELRLGGNPLGVDCETFIDRSRCRPLADLPSGSVSLTATVRDRAGNLSPTASVSFTVAPSDTLGTTTVTGRVQLPGGVPVGGAGVAVLGRPGMSTLSAADGTFTLSGVAVLASETLTVTARLVDANGGLSAVVSGVVPVLSGLTDAGILELKPLCDLGFDAGFDATIGVDAMYPRKAPDFSDTHLRPTIRAMEIFDDGTGPALYVAGEFVTAGGVSARNIARWDGSTWSAVGTNVRGGGLDNRVQTLAVFDDGTGPALYAGGFFSSADGVAADNLAKWDGAAWTGVASILGSGVWALETFDDGGGDALFVGGNFWSVDGVTVANVARWDGTVWTPLADGLGGSFDTVFTLAGEPGNGQTKLYAGGDFTHSGGTLMYRIAAWDGSSWSDLDLGVRVGSTGLTTVSSLAFFGGDLYVGGFFSDVGSAQIASPGVARWTGRAWRAVSGLDIGGFQVFGTSLGVQALEVFDDGSGAALYALGSIRGSVTGISGAARWDGTSWSAVGEGVDADTWGGVALKVFDDDPSDGVPARLYAGAFFRFAEGYGANQIAGWNGQRWLPLREGGLVGSVEALTVNREHGRDVLYAATPGAVSRWDGEELVQIPPPLLFTIKTLALHDDGGGPALYAGGVFDTTGPWNTNGVVRWNGTSWEPLSDGLGSGAQVFALTGYDDRNGPSLIAAGTFVTAGPTRALNIARWDGSSWGPLGTGIDGGTVFALTVFDDGSGASLIAGGFFDTAGGGPVNRIARWDGVGWSPLGAGFNATVSALAVFDDGSGPALYAGGSFTTSGTTSVSGIARWDGSAWQPLGGGVNGNVTAMTVWDDGSGPALYVAGVFTSAGGTTANRLAKWDGSAWSAVGSDLDVQIIGKTGSCGICNLPAVHGLAAFDDGSGPALYVGGQFAHGTFGIRRAFGTRSDGGEVEYLARLHRPLECPVVDAVPPTLAFTQPQDGGVVITDLPEIALSYSDSGSGVDTSTLAIEKDGAPLAVSCTFGAFAATCTPLTALAEGPVTLTATVADVAGNVSAPALVSFTVSLGAPVIQFSSPLDGELLGTATPPITLTYTPNAEPSTLVLQSQPVAVSFTCAPAATSASCTPDAPLAEGLNTLTATIEDGIGQLSTPATVQVTVDTLPPTLTLTAPAEGSTVGSSQPQIALDYADSGAGIDTASLSLLLDGAPLAATCSFLPTGAQCVPDAPIADGPHTVSATVADLSGKVSAPDQVSFTVDTSDAVPPVITVTSPVSGSVTTVAQTSFVGSLDEPGTLTLNGAPVTLDAANAFDHPVTLVEGWNRFVLVATDLVGNQSQQEMRLLLDTTPPSLVILQPMDGSLFDPAVEPVELRVGDNGAGVDAGSLQLETNGVVHGATCTSCSTGFTCTLDPLTDTVVTLVVTLRDLAGNTSTAQALFTSDPTADITPPVLTVSLPQPNTVTSDADVLFLGGVSEPATVTLDGNPVTLDADNNFRHGPVPLVEGSNAFTLLAVDPSGNSDQVDLTVIRDTQAPAPVDAALVTVGGSTGGQVTVTGAAGAVSPVEPGLVVAATNTTLEAPVDLAVQADGSFSGTVPGHGGNRLSLAVRDGAGNHSEPRMFTVPGSPVPPPDPVTVASSLDPTVFTDLCAATAFLWNGADPIQTGVAAGALDCDRVSVVRGRVLDEAGLPLAGVSVAVHERPDLGSTLTRADGRYDLVVEAGPVVLHLATPGRLPVQRRVSALRDAYVPVPDVVLLPLDGQSSPVDLTLATPVQVARGSVSTDVDGSRQATLLFFQGTSAQLRFAGGASTPVSTLTVRATEYTVGARGPAAMPSELPSGTDYTYAVELSVDEALAAGARSVELSQPVVTLVEDFLGFPAGTRVPAGYYDRDRARWIGAPDGRVIQILAIAGGLADLDVDGSGIAADAAALAALGITDAERQQLATLYSVGQSLWRVPVDHLTPWDFNFWARFPAGAEAPKEEKPKGGDRDKKNNPCESSGSIIECDNQILGESLSLIGVPYSLNYRSDRVPGRKVANTLEFTLGGATLPPGVKRIDLQVDVAGQSLVQSFPATPNQTFQLSWDGKDAYGRPVPGRQPYQARLGYVYDVEYQDPPNDCQACFGEGGDGPITGDPARLEGTLAQIFNGRLGAWDAKERLGLGGWSLDVHHFYDPFDKILYRGDGSRRRVDGIQITQVMASVGVPHNLATEPDGTVHFFDGANQQIRRIDPDGTLVIETGAGSLLPGPGVPAQQATLPGLRDIAVGPDGRLYILLDGGDLTQEDTQIWRIEADGTLTYVLGHPAAGGFPLVSTGFLTNPGSMTFDSFGDLYVTDEVLWPPLDPTDEFGKSIVIMKVNLGTGEVRPYVLGLLMITTSNNLIFQEKGPLPPDFGTGLTLTTVGDLAFGPDGSLYFTVNSQGSSVWRKFPDGPVVRLAGSCDGSGSFTCSGFNGDGLGTDVYLFFPEGVVVLDDGTVVFADTGNHRIRAVDTSGYVFTVAGTGQTDPANAGQPATRTNLAFPQDVDFANGDLVYSDTNHGQVHKVGSPSPVVSVGEIRVPSEDGSVIYVFDAGGRHLRTEHARTGEVLLSFGYGDFNGRALLVSITDVYGSTTQIERDALTGEPRALIGPFGQRTDLTLDSFGYLATVTNPAGEVVELGYNPDGLLTSLKDPKLRSYTFEYDPDGRLTKDLDPAGGFSGLSRVELQPNGDVLSGFEVTKTTAMGRTSTHRTESLATGGTRTTVTDPAGVSSITVTRPEQTTQTAPDGTVAVLEEGPDPRFGVQEPQVTKVTVTTPGGLVSTTTTGRTVALVNPLGDPGDPANLAKITHTVNVNGRSMVSEHDLVQGLITTTTPEGRQSVTSVDTRGRVTRIEQPGLEPTVYGYDLLGRLETVAQGTRSVTYAYNPQGLLESVTDPASRTVSYGYDTAGRLTSQTLPDSRVLQFGYDANGNLTSITPPSRPAHQFDYTVVDLPQRYTPPAAGLLTPATTLTYNLDRQVELVTRPDGQTLDYVYEPTTGRLQSVVVPRGTYSYAYDPVSGNLTSVTDPAGGSIGFGYDGALPTSVTWSGEVSGSVDWTYDNSFEVTSRRVNGANEVTFTRDQDGLLTQAGALTLSRRADNGYLTGTSLGQMKDSYTVDLFGDLETHSASFGATELYSADYTPRDELGRITQKAETIGGATDTFGYTYDLAGRLTDVTKNGLAFAHYDYDANGNRTAWTDPWGSGTATYDEQDRLQTYGNLSFTFTDNGELLSKTDGAATVLYDYDVAGNLLGVTLADGIRIDYVLDASNRRVGKKIDGVLVERFLYQDQINPIAELDDTGAVRTLFVYGSRPNVPDYMVRGGQTYRLVSDHLGSVRLVVDTSDGSVVQRIDYGPFGRVLLDTNPGFQPFGFAGGLYDFQTGLVRFGARDYDPETGRWTAKDPIGFGSGATNLYGYVLGDPINGFDPLGLYGWEDFLQDAANFSAGFADTITFGLTRKVRQWMGTDHIVDPCAGFYKAGKVAGHIWQAAAVEAGAARGIQALRAARFRSTYASKLYYYTDDATAQIIEGSRLGRRGHSLFLTPKGGLSPVQAQIELALPMKNTGQAVFEVSTEGMNPALVSKFGQVVGNVFGRGGGGTELVYEGTIPLRYLTRIR